MHPRKNLLSVRVVGLLACLPLSVLVPGRAYAQSSAGNQAVQPSWGVQPGGGGSAPQPGTVSPRQAPNKTVPNVVGLTVHVGIGYGVGFGSFFSAAPDDPSDLPTHLASIGDALSGLLPLSLGIGYRPIPLLSFGVALGHAPIFLKDCNDCEGSDRRVGGELRVHLLSGARLSPWVSAGFGYEWFSYSKNPGYDSSRQVRARGFDFDLQAGGDFPLKDFMTVGPYVGLRLGVFEHFYTRCGDRSCVVQRTDYDIPEANMAAHEWLTFGVRGAFTFPVR